MITIERVTTLKRKATEIIAQVKRKRRPVLITHRGLPTAYLIDAESFDRLQSRMEILEGIALGETALREGRTLTQEQVEKKLRRWLK
ncbi:MAG TPA: type II toxin-antitoxin system prevent-host-death family antitoxin [Candidatus Methylacidiphilales bacterium]|nr:type II toxin-antitoxin system prevent-host-death family antitoxin [Candidatus Methylacidiphilales bacterium]